MNLWRYVLWESDAPYGVIYDCRVVTLCNISRQRVTSIRHLSETTHCESFTTWWNSVISKIRTSEPRDACAGIFGDKKRQNWQVVRMFWHHPNLFCLSSRTDPMTCTINKGLDVWDRVDVVTNIKCSVVTKPSGAIQKSIKLNLKWIRILTLVRMVVAVYTKMLLYFWRALNLYIFSLLQIEYSYTRMS